jgi:putative transposase
MKFRFIDAAKENFPVTRLCQVLGVSQSGYVAWRSRPASPRQREDLVLLAHIRSAFTLSHETYGSPRMTRELQDEGLTVGRRRTARLMRENGLKAGRSVGSNARPTVIMPFRSHPTCSSRTSRLRVRTRSGPRISPICGRTRAGCTWPWSSISSPGGWSAGRSDSLHKELAVKALRKALAIRRPGKDLIHHADRGSQYCSTAYRAELRKHGIQVSMSGKGNCFDNTVVETFFKT